MPVVIIGAGLVGLATGYALLRSRPGLNVIVLEKEAGPGLHQSGRNSGVLHAGLHYTPGSEKARLSRVGIRAMKEFAQRHGIAHEICGNLVVAATPDELPRLDELIRRGTANGLGGLRKLSIEEAREIEPHVGGVAAVHVREEGIIDYPAVSRALVAEILHLGGSVRFGHGVRTITQRATSSVIETDAGHVEAAFLCNCAGLHSDRVARMAGHATGARIVPFRGEYFMLTPERSHLVRSLIYPVPHPSFPFLGVHFTRMVAGGIEAGPNAVLALKREGYTKKDFALKDAAATFFFPGLWRFVARYPRATLRELHQTMSRRAFAAALARLVPDVRPEDLVPARAGVRAQAMQPDGSLVQDFLFVEQDRALHVINAPSPAATAALAIGDEIARRVVVALG